MFGSEIGELALPLLAIITLSASAGEVGLLRTAQFAPFLIFTLPLGVLVERRRKLPLMMFGDLGRFVLIGAILSSSGRTSASCGSSWYWFSLLVR